MHCDFLGPDGLQETHMDAFKPFNSKLVTLTMRGGFFTKFSALAHGVAPPAPPGTTGLHLGSHTGPPVGMGDTGTSPHQVLAATQCSV